MSNNRKIIENLDKAKMQRHEAIELAKKALEDVGHWEDFNEQKATFITKEIDNYYDANHWIVSFKFSNGDDAFPILIVIDETKFVYNISWKSSHFHLSYDKNKNKYYHPELSK